MKYTGFFVSLPLLFSFINDYVLGRPMLRNVGRSFYARIGPFRAIWRVFPSKWTNGPSGGQKARKTKIREK